MTKHALVHGHCHQKALDTLNDKEIGNLFAEKEILDKMGLEYKHPESGCCGMAGAFGYEKENDHYEVGVAAGERVLLPEVRQAAEDELIVADGFSCQEQIEQETNRTALHTAQVLQMALRGDDGGCDGVPEKRNPGRSGIALGGSVWRGAALWIGGIFVAGASLRELTRRRGNKNFPKGK